MNCVNSCGTPSPHPVGTAVHGVFGPCHKFGPMLRQAPVRGARIWCPNMLPEFAPEILFGRTESCAPPVTSPVLNDNPKNTKRLQISRNPMKPIGRKFGHKFRQRIRARIRAPDSGTDSGTIRADPDRTSGRFSGRHFGRNSEIIYGRNYGRNSGRHSGRNYCRKSGMNSGRKSDRNSGRNSDRKFGRNSGRNSGTISVQYAGCGRRPSAGPCWWPLGAALFAAACSRHLDSNKRMGKQTKMGQRIGA